MLTYAVDVLKLATRPKLRDGPQASTVSAWWMTQIFSQAWNLILVRLC